MWTLVRSCLRDSKLGHLCLLVASLLVPSAEAWGQNVAQFRYMSTVIRDQLPTTQEAKDFYNGDKTLDQFITSWLASEEHLKRVGRYLNDQFGHQDFSFVSEQNTDLIRSQYGLTAFYPNWDTDRFLDFVDDDGTHVAVLDFQAYYDNVSDWTIVDPDQITSMIATAMNAQTSQTIAVTYSRATATFTITNTSGSVLSLLWNSGANAANTIGDKLNFNVGADQTGSVSYDSGANPETWASLNFTGGLLNMPNDLAAQEIDGVYYLDKSTKATCGAVVAADAWWSDTQIQICSTALSPAGIDLTHFYVTAADQYIDFTDSSGTHAAFLNTPGLPRYMTHIEIAAALETAMNLASPQTYEVSLWKNGGQLLIRSSTTSFTLLNSTGTNAANTLADTAGWPTTDQPSYTSAVWPELEPGYNYVVAFANGTKVRCITNLADANCGCGKEQIMCYPREHKGKVMSAIRDEFKSRGLYYYEQDGSWLDLYGGDKFYGNRWLYQHYVYQQDTMPESLNPPQVVIDQIKSLSTTTKSLVDMPDLTQNPNYSGPDGPERAGVVTSPAFLRRFNNYRARIRAITERLMCKDIDGSLNIDNYSSFNNPNFVAGQPNNVVEHGSQDGCADCHYSMDNFAATIILWGDNSEGFFSSWGWNEKSHLGHVFGEDGSGPRFLMEKYTEQEEFTACMAKKAWEDFSGLDWGELTASDQQKFIQAAQSGPRSTIRTILTSTALKKVRNPDPVKETTTTTVTYDFNTDINPILTAKCVPCHAAGGSQPGKFVELESNFKSINKARLSDGSMPPAGPALTQAEIDKMLIWIDQ